MQRKLAAILAADIAGFSRLVGADEEGTLAAMRAARAELIDPLLARHAGRLANTAGDSMLVEFPSAVEAVRFAEALQEGMATRAEAVAEDARLLFRVGLNLGDVVAEGDDLLGDGVNVAARLEALAPAGGIVLSRSVRDQVRDRLDLALADLGEIEVKNIARPVRAFQLLAPGETPIRPPTPASSPTPAKPSRRVPLLAGAALAALLALGAGWYLTEPAFEPADPAAMAFPLPDKPSIAVLPFRDLTAEGGQSAVADGMTEDLITDLSKVSGLFVIARNSSFAYRGAETEIRRIAEALGVRYVLAGSLRRSGDTLRVNTQLVDATSGGHVWADRFDGDVTDIFEVQDAFARQIIGALELTLTPQEDDSLAVPEGTTIAAKEAFQQGWEFYSRFNEEDNARAEAFFKQAIALDPDYARAHGALALVYLRGSIFHWEGALGQQRAALYRELVPAALRGAGDRDTALVHVVRAMQHLFYRHGTEPEGPNRGTDDARVEAALAIALQPSDPEAHITMAWALIAAGRAEEGLGFVEAAMRLNPNHPSHYVFFEAAAHLGMGDAERAAAILDAGIARDPRARELLPLAAAVEARLGRREQARARLDLWQPDAGTEALDAAIKEYSFPIRWVDNGVNAGLRDGLSLAALPPEVTVEGLLAELEDATGRDKLTPIRRLGWFGAAAAPAVPALTSTLDEPLRLIKREAAVTLGKIGPEAAPALPALELLTGQPIIGFHARTAIEAIRAE